MQDPPRLLIVDDDQANRELLLRRLTSRGFRCTEAAAGTECLAKVAAEPFDLVLLDLNMPGMNGLEVLGTLRKTWSGDTLPVILVTALGQTEDMVAGLEAGANDYVVKPVNLPVLMARVRVCLRLKQGAELLMEAERERVLIETLGNACNQLAQPLTAITVMLEMLTQDPEPAKHVDISDLGSVLTWTREAGSLIHKLRAVAQSHQKSYTERLSLMDRGVVPMKKG